MRTLRGILAIITILWLVAGIVAAAQRGLFREPPEHCSQAATIAAVIVAGPLNYLGLNPRLGCELPQPSS
ncbi:hypothetical protein BIU82_14250 [Arthrobacter sp. SW1]|uniref:hypothetical protein n=1 Tax=Arthrobacter sp. SW1 TaxID=1920889 RepID=UPI000877B3F0|nr:hypothetical protein [Arthrobacter sp. SW1]OFI39482.1 hypothetical protein BIU82_14250 [Arthrobacter sp. SW1]